MAEVFDGKSAEISEDLLGQREVREAVEYLKESGFSDGELAAYEKYWDGVSVERTLLADAIAGVRPRDVPRVRPKGAPRVRFSDNKKRL